MGNRLEGKNAIVTAAGQGIGKATAITFHNEGAKVTATDINNETLADLNKEYPNISVKKLDSTNNGEIKSFVNDIDKIDILFNAVGFVHHGTILDCDSEEFHNSVNINIYSAYLWCFGLLAKRGYYPLVSY